MENIKTYRLPITLATMVVGMLLVAAVAVPALAQNNSTNGQAGGMQGNCTGQTGGTQGNMMGGMMNGSTGKTIGSMMGDVDRRFIEQMIPHHQAAVAMADLALQKAQRSEIKALSARIKRVQTDEIAQMRAWYKQWYGTDVPTTNTGNSGGMMGNMNMGGMMGGSVEVLAKATDFDKAFIEAMIPHHQMALMMSNMMLAHGEKADLKGLARSIITSQSAEIQQMQTWYKQWYNSVP